MWSIGWIILWSKLETSRLRISWLKTVFVLPPIIHPPRHRRSLARPHACKWARACENPNARVIIIFFIILNKTNSMSNSCFFSTTLLTPPKARPYSLDRLYGLVPSYVTCAIQTLKTCFFCLSLSWNILLTNLLANNHNSMCRNK